MQSLEPHNPVAPRNADASEPPMTFPSGQSAHDLRVGEPIYTLDGHHIGELAELQGLYFKVSAAVPPDYWLSVDSIESLSPERVVLRLSHERLIDHKVERPLAA
jgi:hypothetical protein